eukprot:5076241-Amphidinium_carterae.1
MHNNKDVTAAAGTAHAQHAATMKGDRLIPSVNCQVSVIWLWAMSSSGAVSEDAFREAATGLRKPSDFCS